MGVENFGENAVAGKRKTKRARVLISAKIQTAAGELEVRLRDLSQRGALVESEMVPPVGSQVMFLRGSITVPARVAWTGGNRVGLEFDYMIDESEVLIQLNRKTASETQQRFRRPRLYGEDMTEHDRKLARVWGLAVGIDVPGQ